VSISLRKFRALVGTYRDAGTTGQVTANYVRQSSGDADHMWWVSKAQPTGREVTTGMKAEHRLDAVLGFAAVAPVTEDGAVQIDSVDYLVRAMLDRDYGRDEVQVYVERAPSALVWVTS
jgi:hypothetical protein